MAEPSGPKPAAKAAPPGGAGDRPPADPDKALAVPVAIGSVVAAVAGVILRKLGSDSEPKLLELTQRMARERNKEVVQRLSVEKQDLDFAVGLQLSIGTGLLVLGGCALLAAALVQFGGVKPRRAALFLFPGFLYIALYATYMVGVSSLAVTGFGAIALLAWVTSGPNERARKELEDFRTFPARAEIDVEGEGHPYRAAYIQVRQTKVLKLLRTVSSLPPELARMLPLIGEGRPVAYYQLKKNIAYVAVVEADAYNLSDFCVVLMSLEETAPRFVARPLPIVEGRRVKNTGVKFKDDPEFMEEFLVEPSPGSGAPDLQKIRDFLSDEARDALFDLPKAWLIVEKNAMAVATYGAFDADVADQLVVLADVLFAEHGAEGGPTLFEPDGAVDLSGKSATKKKRKKLDPAPATPPQS